MKRFVTSSLLENENIFHAGLRSICSVGLHGDTYQLHIVVTSTYTSACVASPQNANPRNAIVTPMMFETSRATINVMLFCFTSRCPMM